MVGANAGELTFVSLLVCLQVRRVLETSAADEGSSSEDTSDEAYARMHKPLEEDEHIRLCGPTGMYHVCWWYLFSCKIVC